MNITTVANEIWIDMGSPTTTSIPAIAFWIRGKVGTINNMLFVDYYINDETQELESSSGGGVPYEIVAVIKQLYKLYDWELQIRSLTSSIATNSIIEINDQGTSVKRINKNSIIQNLVTIRKDEIDMLKTLVTDYRSKYSSPQAVHGDDCFYNLNQDNPTTQYIYYRR